MSGPPQTLRDWGPGCVRRAGVPKAEALRAGEGGAQTQGDSLGRGGTHQCWQHRDPVWPGRAASSRQVLWVEGPAVAGQGSHADAPAAGNHVSGLVPVQACKCVGCRCRAPQSPLGPNVEASAPRVLQPGPCVPKQREGGEPPRKGRARSDPAPGRRSGSWAVAASQDLGLRFGERAGGKTGAGRRRRGARQGRSPLAPLTTMRLAFQAPLPPRGSQNGHERDGPG